MADKVAAYRVKLKASISFGGSIKCSGGGAPAKAFPISYFRVTYELNAVPEAEVHIALGRNLSDTEGVPIGGLDFFTHLDAYTPVTINVEADTGSGPSGPPGSEEPFPTGSFPVFVGFAYGPAFSKSAGGSASLVLRAFGALGAIAGASQFSQTMVSHSNYSGSSLISVKLGQQGAVGYIAQEALANALGNVSTDVWGKGLFEIMDTLLNSDTPRYEDHVAKMALDALARLEPNAHTTLKVDGASTMPFRQDLGTGGEVIKMLNRNINDSLVNILYSNWVAPGGSANLFDVLLAFAREFYVYLVPGICEDAILPITPCLGAIYSVITPDEYWDFAVANERERDGPSTVYAHVTTCAINAGNFYPSPWKGGTTVGRSIGFFTYNDKIDHGGAGRMILMSKPPKWLLPSESPGNISLNIGKGIPDASNPTQFAVPPYDQSTVETQYMSSGLGNGYAQAVVQENMFAHNQMSLTGRFRMDICPGSTVAVETPGESFIGDHETLYGLVNTVTLQMGGEAGHFTAATSYGISSVRTEDEQHKFTSVRHPLFDSRFVGGKLLNY